MNSDSVGFCVRYTRSFAVVIFFVFSLWIRNENHKCYCRNTVFFNAAMRIYFKQIIILLHNTTQDLETMNKNRQKYRLPFCYKQFNRVSIYLCDQFRLIYILQHTKDKIYVIQTIICTGDHDFVTTKSRLNEPYHEFVIFSYWYALNWWSYTTIFYLFLEADNTRTSEPITTGQI
jgi:hypothetical protein